MKKNSHIVEKAMPQEKSPRKVRMATKVEKQLDSWLQSPYDLMSSRIKHDELNDDGKAECSNYKLRAYSPN